MCKRETQQGCSNTRDEARDTWGLGHRHADGDFRGIYVEMEKSFISNVNVIIFVKYIIFFNIK